MPASACVKSFMHVKAYIIESINDMIKIIKIKYSKWKLIKMEWRWDCSYNCVDSRQVRWALIRQIHCTIDGHLPLVDVEVAVGCAASTAWALIASSSRAFSLNKLFIRVSQYSVVEFHIYCTSSVWITCFNNLLMSEYCTLGNIFDMYRSTDELYSIYTYCRYYY